MSALSPVLAATIDNLAPARPQTGLTDANVGYVLPVEGGLSRILAPVRLALSVTRPPGTYLYRSGTASGRFPGLAVVVPWFGA